ncbi:pyridoxamine 5'-phosphate oxidase family protein [Streptomonospora sp. PA3]|uniref:pyridoxamine 5'-phosphate oxidase family protein n=1 Tax=Streptomonospora sp. PA3 TaxID=2607326 RepID=UPI0012DE46CC|nr:pyridoxamine 5'-phosphate oxidase family protein [Streptomonospora sp. PA3]MUL41908.1 pyridoxamine 5'-phosphate oxidase family protein [Streptomonospora sp. PA3]
MHETRAELDELQRLLARSLDGASGHLRAVYQADSERPHTLDAEQLVRVLTGMCTLAVSSVTARGEPRVSGADGHFLHGRWIFGTDRSAAKARHLAARPGISAAHLRGDDLGVFTHGTAVPISPPDADGPDAAEWPAVHEHLIAHYGESPMNWGEVVYYRIEPRWMTAYCSDPAKLLAEA